MVALDPAVADEVPWADALTAYDDAHLVLYLRVLDAEAAGADWRQVARILLQRDATAEPERALRCWNAHLKRAQWIAETKYNERLREALLQDIGIVETFDQRA
jgi:predicted secreted protein